MRLVIAVLALAASAAPQVTITRTSHGIPHISAGSYYRIKLRVRTSRRRTLSDVRRARTCAGRRS